MPNAVLVRPTDCAASRKVVATRLITLQVRVSSSLRPLILLRGERPSHEQNALALRHLLMSTPISETMSNTLKTLSPLKQSSQRDSLRDRTRASPMLSPQNQRNRALQRAFKAPPLCRSWLPPAALPGAIAPQTPPRWKVPFPQQMAQAKWGALQELAA